MVTFVDSRAAVEESAGMVSLLLVATGAEVGTAFTVQVDPSEAVPPSARGEWVGQGSVEYGVLICGGLKAMISCMCQTVYLLARRLWKYMMQCYHLTTDFLASFK